MMSSGLRSAVPWNVWRRLSLRSSACGWRSSSSLHVARFRRCRKTVRMSHSTPCHIARHQRRRFEFSGCLCNLAATERVDVPQPAGQISGDTMQQATKATLTSKVYDVDDFAAAQEFYHSNGWTDGLPVVPPPEETVAACLA